MNFDDTELVICQRSTSDLLDMTLRVWEKYHWRLLSVYLLGCIPFALLNMALLGWMVTEDGLVSGELLDSSVTQTRLRYFCDHAILVFLELPLAGAMATAFLGEVTFKQKPTTAHLIRSVFKQWRGVLLVLGVLRFGVLGPMLLLFLPRYGSYDLWIELLGFALVAAGLALATRAFRPFAPEIVVLERCELKPRDKSHPRYGKRSSWLHSPVATECFARMTALSMINLGGVIALILTYLFFQGVITSSWQWSWVMDWIVVPVVFWGLGAYATVFRFLCYLDSRIALEGWEIELLMRAEASRLQATQVKGVV